MITTVDILIYQFPCVIFSLVEISKSSGITGLKEEALGLRCVAKLNVRMLLSTSIRRS